MGDYYDIVFRSFDWSKVPDSNIAVGLLTDRFRVKMSLQMFCGRFLCGEI